MNKHISFGQDTLCRNISFQSACIKEHMQVLELTSQRNAFPACMQQFSVVREEMHARDMHSLGVKEEG
jgi:hypothetical protein